MDAFKENIIGLQLEQKNIDAFNNLQASIKANFTKMYNNIYKSSIKAVKKGKVKDSPDTFTLSKNLDAGDEEDCIYVDSDSDEKEEVEVEVKEEKKRRGGRGRGRGNMGGSISSKTYGSGEANQFTNPGKGESNIGLAGGRGGTGRGRKK